MTDWIDIKKKTPEIMTNVLVRRKNEEIQVAHLISYPKNTWRIRVYNHDLDINEELRFRDVIYWKVLEE